MEAIPLAQVVQEADKVMADLAAMQADLASDVVVDKVESAFSSLGRDFDDQLLEITALVRNKPTLDVLHSEEERLQALGKDLPQWRSDLTTRATRLQGKVQDLHGVIATWTQTQVLAREAGAPPELELRIQNLLASARLTREHVEKQLAMVLKLQSRVAERSARLASEVAEVYRVRREAVGQLLDRDSAPFWRRDQWAVHSLWTASKAAMLAQWDSVISYFLRHVESVLLHVLVVILVMGSLKRVRPQVQAWAKEEPACESLARIFEVPFQVAVVLSLLLTHWLYPQPPRALGVLLFGLALLPATGILRRLIEPSLFPLLYAVVVAYFLDVVRTAEFLPLKRLVVLVQMMGGIVFLLVFLRARSARGAVWSETDPLWKTVRLGGRLAVVGFGVSVVANLLGYFNLAKVMDTAVLGGIFLALVMYAGVRVLGGMASFALRVRPLCLLDVVTRRRLELARHVQTAVSVVAAVVWLLYVMDMTGVRGSVLAVAARVWSGDVALGLSLGSVVTFAAVVWASFALSRLLRLVLEDDVYPRLSLARGVPFVVSTLLHYAVLLVGFLMATSALGVDMTKFTILAGAFSLGLGFGLQNILNNFVSGLILLVERPVKVGDVVDLKAYSGRLEHIGLRASILRTFSGSAVVVPNGTLISSEFVNWTLSDTRRRLEVTLPFSLEVDPGVALPLLLEVAQANPAVLADPKPQALVLGFAEGRMNVSLRAWTDHGERWAVVQSELNCAVYQALVEAGIPIVTSA